MIEILQETIMFRAFSNEELKNLNEMTNVINLATNFVLFQQGERCDYFYFVISGSINLSRVSEQGGEKVIEIMHKGDYFAESLMFLNKPFYPVRAVAVKSTTLIAIDVKKYLHMINESKNAALQLLGDFSWRIHQLVTQLDEVTFYTSKSRVANYLLKCSEQNNALSFTLDAPKNVIASKLTMKPETFSRALRLFDELELISMQKNIINIPNKEDLVFYINEENQS